MPCARSQGDQANQCVSEYTPAGMAAENKESMEALQSIKTADEKKTGHAHHNQHHKRHHHQRDEPRSSSEEESEEGEEDSESQSNHEHMDESYFHRELPELADLPLPPDPNKMGPRPPYTFQSGAIYHGQWRGRTRHGFGMMKWTDGASFSGQWVNNVAEGHGEFFHADEDTYFGQWE